MGRILVFSLRTGRGLCGIFKQGIKKFLVSRSSWPLVGRVVRNGGECEWGRISRSRSVGSASASLVTGDGRGVGSFKIHTGLGRG